MRILNARLTAMKKNQEKKYEKKSNQKKTITNIIEWDRDSDRQG